MTAGTNIKNTFDIECLYNALDMLYDNDNVIIIHSDYKKILKNDIFEDHRGKLRVNGSEKLISFSKYITKEQGVYMPIIKPNKKHP